MTVRLFFCAHGHPGEECQQKLTGARRVRREKNCNKYLSKNDKKLLHFDASGASMEIRNFLEDIFWNILGNRKE